MSPSTSTGSAPGASGILRALRSRNYRLYFAGQGTSLIGTWMTGATIAWVVNERSLHSRKALMLGLVAFASQFPAFILAPFAGVWIDRLNRQRILVVTQVLSMIESFALAALALTHMIQVWHILALCAFQGLVNAFDMPSRQVFLIELIDQPEDLGNAIALNSSVINAARVLGPAIAGFTIKWIGPGWSFVADGVSYLAVIASLYMMVLPPPKVVPHHPKLIDSLREGAAYAFGFPPIRTLLLIFALVCLTGTRYQVLVPIFATDIFHGGPIAYGLLGAATGVGALIGALYLANRPSVLGLGRILVIATFIFGIALIALALAHVLWLGLLFLVLVGMGMIVHMAAVNTLVQTIVDNDKRGRVMSYYTMMFTGAMPFGSLLAGELADRIGAPWTVACGGMVCIFAGGVLAWRLPRMRPLIHPIYVRKGILPGAPEMIVATEFEAPSKH